MELLLFWGAIISLHFIMRSLGFKPDKTKAYCGLSGYVGTKPANIDKIKILGLYNTTRGTDSCGIAINNVVKRGTGTEANFSSFIEKETLEVSPEDENFTIIGHTRKASFSYSTTQVWKDGVYVSSGNRDAKKDAHPFEIFKDDNSTDAILIGAHNGTITNKATLKEKYGITEDWIDSQVVLAILAKNRKKKNKYEVLKDYDGTAALIWLYTDEPNTIYIWKGGEVKTNWVDEERPLYVYRQDDNHNSVYFSSIEESLMAIGGVKDKTLFDVPCNNVICIKAGNPKYRTEPVERNPIKATTTTNSHYSSHTTKVESKAEVMRRTFLGYPESSYKKALKELEKEHIWKTTRANADPSVLLDFEPYPFRANKIKDKVYFWRGRYYINDRMLGEEGIEVLELDIYGYNPKNSKVEDDFSNYTFYKGLLIKPGEEENFKRRLENFPHFFTPFNMYEHIAPFVFGVLVKTKDTGGFAKHGTSMNITHEFTSMFDYRTYTFVSGWFVSSSVNKNTINETINKVFEGITDEDDIELFKIIEMELREIIEKAQSAVDEIDENLKAKSEFNKELIILKNFIYNMENCLAETNTTQSTVED